MWTTQKLPLKCVSQTIKGTEIMKKTNTTVSEQDILNLIANSQVCRLDLDANGNKMAGFARNVECYSIGKDFRFEVHNPNGGMWSYSAELRNNIFNTRIVLIYDIFTIRTIKMALNERLAAQYVQELDAALFRKNNAIWNKLARMK
jgi:hypothetical protein